MSSKLLQSWFPWVQTPVIVNGPMLNAACPHLAVEVSKSGGIGFIASIFNIEAGSEHMEKIQTDLAELSERLGDHVGQMPVGISFITGHDSITTFSEAILPLIFRYKPAAVWLFAPNGDVKPHGNIIAALKRLESPPRVFVQVGNVSAAKEAVQDGADVIVCQGIDAGGHQFRRGMGVISLVPEAKQMLAESFPDKQVPLLAAGGIVNGKGVAAALALGADGVVMGTRFTVAKESVYPDFRKKAVVAARDGGTVTFKSPFNDQVHKHTLWGPLYDGRQIVTSIHQKFLDGATLEECQVSLADVDTDTKFHLIGTWAGTGVGLVTEEATAAEILDEVRSETRQVARSLAASLQ